LEIIIVILLILLNGIFSLSEIALISSKKIRLEHLRDKDKRGAKIALNLLSNSENFLSSIQIGITLIGIITGYYGGINFAKYFTPLFSLMPCSSCTAETLSVITSIIIITFFSILLGELVPKTVALSKPEKAAVVVAPIIYFVSVIFFPIVKLLEISTNLTNKMLGIKPPQNQVTEEELRHIIKVASREGVIEEEQNVIHEKLFYFSDKRAKHIMTHRSEIEWIDKNLPADEFAEQLLNFKNSKILVCDRELDKYIGVLKIKEFLIKKITETEFNIEDLLDEPVVCPENAEAQDVLNEFRKRQIYFCVVIDEFGMVVGLITLHDILENIIGELPEEEEVVEPDITPQEDDSFLVNGDAPIEVLLDIMENFEIDFEEIDYATVAGFVLENIEKLPEIGDAFDFNNYHIEIINVEHNRIDKVLISQKKEE
jgi:putative hemolysin